MMAVCRRVSGGALRRQHRRQGQAFRPLGRGADISVAQTSCLLVKWASSPPAPQPQQAGALQGLRPDKPLPIRAPAFGGRRLVAALELVAAPEARKGRLAERVRPDARVVARTSCLLVNGLPARRLSEPTGSRCYGSWSRAPDSRLRRARGATATVTPAANTFEGAGRNRPPR